MQPRHTEWRIRRFSLKESAVPIINQGEAIQIFFND
jgi:hypothetical protein